MVMLPKARVPEGLRLYAIGDVHGRLDLLEAVHDQITADLGRRPVADWRVIHLGDYVDRGPDSLGVLDFLLRRGRDPRQVFLRGNHDQFLIDFLAARQTGDLSSFDLWLMNGGDATLQSVIEGDWMRAVYLGDDGALRDLAAEVAAALPEGLLGFLDGLEHMRRFGDYAFVHAGVKPGVALEAQEPRDLMWIRGPFLGSDADHGAVVVHGHTPVDEVEVRRNRIGIDTGAVFNGRLCCLVLEGGTQALLGLFGPEPLDGERS